MFAVIKFYDDQSEGLGRQTIASMIITASGNTLSRDQALRTWDKTIHPLGKQLGLLTGYVKPQEGSSKRTAAGAVDLQRDWHVCCDELFATIRRRAMEVLGGDKALVDKFMVWLIANMDEECLHALGKNAPTVGSKTKKKHDNQNKSHRLPTNNFFEAVLGIVFDLAAIIFFC